MLELESAKKELKQEKEKTQKTARHFLHLLKVALQEKDEAQKQRDEARNQLQLLIKAKASSSSSDYYNISNTTHTQQFYAAAVPTLTSAGSSNAGLAKLPQVVGMDIVSSSSMRERQSDNDSFVYDSLLERISYKPLPKKGRLLQAVVEAGPLLQPFLIAPLPQWNNPPTPTTTLPMPLPVFQDSITANLPYAKKHSSSASYNPNSSSSSINFNIDQIPYLSVFKPC
ncbi:uncharacterized protein LOC133832700 [Humulus lupulus]|uniref:uncharacterized protein LOC133832700 n=1 Tax=Humulus lupulus TaxID=3486 RepID=UPI002B4043A0|nr:uncharacterized protein LOC133832700 [Humulus lupulus]